jgi:hypothetical protein
MRTIRDFEFGERPTCKACGCELDPETDTYHDGYEGSPYAHGGNGSYGMGSHHFVFSSYCECCSYRPEPLKKILQYDSQYEWLECGHKLLTPRNRFGGIRPGLRRRCRKCKQHAPQDFDAREMQRLQRKEAFTKKLKKQRNCTVTIPYRSTEQNWYRHITSLGLTSENCGFENWWGLIWNGCEPEERSAKLRAALAGKAAYDLAQERHEWAYNSDDH